MLFTTPLSEVTFNMIEAFCQQWEEGVRVEYKRLVPETIPKIASSFANTMGGILIIGVKTEGTRAVLPISGMTLSPQVEEQITQSCYQGIYPALGVSLRTFQLPSDATKGIVVVKVAESLEAPHAIQNKEQVYIRVNSTSEPYKLADIDRIEYLLSRRREPETRRERLIESAFSRNRVDLPCIRIAIGPKFPYRPIHTGDSLYEAVLRLQGNSRLSFITRDLRRIQSGMVTVGGSAHHLELNFYGVLWYAEPVNLVSFDRGGVSLRYIPFQKIVIPIGRLLQAAELFLPETTMNLFARITLDGAKGHAIKPDGVEADLFIPEHTSIENSLTAEIDIIRETAPNDFLNNVCEIVRQLMWSFDWEDTEAVKNSTLRVLEANGPSRPS